jgi:hypothetical protein
VVVRAIGCIAGLGALAIGCGGATGAEFSVVAGVFFGTWHPAATGDFSG